MPWIKIPDTKNAYWIPSGRPGLRITRIPEGYKEVPPPDSQVHSSSQVNTLHGANQATSSSNANLDQNESEDFDDERKFDAENVASEELKTARQALELTLAVFSKGPGNKSNCTFSNGASIEDAQVRRNADLISELDETWKHEFTKSNILDRTYEAILSGTGNCDHHAFVAFCYLIMKGIRNVYICQSRGIAHTFVIIGNLANRSTKKVIICDPWADVCIEANSNFDKGARAWRVTNQKELGKLATERGIRSSSFTSLYSPLDRTDVYGNLKGTTQFTFSLSDWERVKIDNYKSFSRKILNIEAMLKSTNSSPHVDFYSAYVAKYGPNSSNNFTTPISRSMFKHKPTTSVPFPKI